MMFDCVFLITIFTFMWTWCLTVSFSLLSLLSSIVLLIFSFVNNIEYGFKDKAWCALCFEVLVHNGEQNVATWSNICTLVTGHCRCYMWLVQFIICICMYFWYWYEPLNDTHLGILGMLTRPKTWPSNLEMIHILGMLTRPKTWPSNVPDGRSWCKTCCY